MRMLASPRNKCSCLLLNGEGAADATLLHLFPKVTPTNLIRGLPGSTFLVWSHSQKERWQQLFEEYSSIECHERRSTSRLEKEKSASGYFSPSDNEAVYRKGDDVASPSSRGGKTT